MWKKTIMLTLALFICLAAFSSIQAQRDPIDRETEDNIRKLLNRELSVSADNIMIAVEKGQVTLSGTVDHLLAKERAARLAQRVPGVEGVNNDIELIDIKIGNEELKRNIRRALKDNEVTADAKISMNVHDGIVDLYGKVGLPEMKTAIQNIVQQTRGVREVDNQIEVTSSG